MKTLHHVVALGRITAEDYRLLDLAQERRIDVPTGRFKYHAPAVNDAIHEAVKRYPQEFVCDCQVGVPEPEVACDNRVGLPPAHDASEG